MDQTEGGGRPARSPRGERRRTQIIEAALAVVYRDGASGVTHRAVAQEAGIAVGLSVYYFASLDDLLVAALSAVADEYADRIEAILNGPDDNLRGLAELIVECAGEGRERALAERELCTLSVRRPALLPVAGRWRQNVERLAATVTTDPDAIVALTATADGLSTAVLLGTVPPDVERVHRILLRAVG
ncbi:TetR/AcrR family transcriptional regulator [Tsukamurella ocularis]|uniref:TetR/AcrR family transcriptional regulator n=1 Tax=Tsukamurella ocularis TaxID=1970234 RepID=UPI0021678AFE|nr:TetR family transcriptional regulator [Tsukamurella ocularis]MCS3779421.1 DNA-binding transcriptional regulator YbjK [Tsukamurella ocularis]MCS3789924.1 DNA-binding transcriptional regulator YbjK [Tsukamurella ocularis]MCS3852421.1 DNA-binding transcriptional regulator YbjK [Tsukamurella ocularis]